MLDYVGQRTGEKRGDDVYFCYFKLLCMQLYVHTFLQCQTSRIIRNNENIALISEFTVSLDIISHYLT